MHLNNSRLNNDTQSSIEYFQVSPLSSSPCLPLYSPYLPLFLSLSSPFLVLPLLPLSLVLVPMFPIPILSPSILPPPYVPHHPLPFSSLSLLSSQLLPFPFSPSYLLSFPFPSSSLCKTSLPFYMLTSIAYFQKKNISSFFLVHRKRDERSKEEQRGKGLREEQEGWQRGAGEGG